VPASEFPQMQQTKIDEEFKDVRV